MAVDGMAPVPADPAGAWVADASPEVVAAWSGVRRAAGADLPVMSLTAGDRPAADVEVLASAAASCEYLLASRMHAAAASGALPLGDRGGVLAARGWSGVTARRLARGGALAADHPGIAVVWAAGVITAEHVDPIARAADRFTPPELAAVIGELGPHWGSWSPAAIGRFVVAADRMLHPPPDPSPEETDAYESRALSFALTHDTVLISGELPRLEGELVIAAVDALAERLRSTADHVPATARRADALVQLVNTAHATGALPSRGGLPVSLTVTLDHTSLGDPVCTTSRGHQMTQAETRWASCDASITPVLIDTPGCAGPDGAPPACVLPAAEVGGAAGVLGDDACGYSSGAEGAFQGGTGGDGIVPAAGPPSPAARIAALAALMFDTRIPLDVGRTQRTATPAQRRALAIRDRGCAIPGCDIPAEACQTHHLEEWAAGGASDLSNMVLVCWSHHRQVDLGMWRLESTQYGAPPIPTPQDNAPPGTPWPANNGAPFVITRTRRDQWRL